MIMKGQKINDRYQIVKSIGEGGMANVYLAYDTILDRDVAVKVLRGDLSNDEKFVRRFQREALNASSLSHPNIVEVYDVGDDNGEYFIVMEYIDGQNLKDLLKKRGKLTVPEVIDIMSQIADGLSVAHDSYIIHRDIKPQNIMILDNGMVKITDFGIAMAMNATQLTQTNSVMGSVHYLPPEQASGKGATLKSDIYSMGILMYELLTGVLPYRGDNAVEIALKHLKEPLPSIRDLIDDLPQSVENIILKSTAKNPKNRYNDARAMYEDLKTCLDESRLNEERWEYQYPELDDGNKKFTKQVEKAIDVSATKDNGEVDVVKVKPEEVKKENKIVVTLAIIFTVLILFVTVLLILFFKVFKSADVIVPDVSGKTSEEAVNILQEAGFEVSDVIKEVPDDNIPEGRIAKTHPPIGTKRNRGSLITLYVSTGEDKVLIEDYTGMNAYEVKGSLQTKGINVYIEPKEVNKSSKYKTGVVISQSVKAGEKLGKNESIELFIPKIEVKYPDFTDGTWTVEAVQRFCDENKVILKVKTEQHPGKPGAIFYQSRKKGDKVVDGIALIIKVASEESSDEEECNPDLEDCEVIDPEVPMEDEGSELE